MKCFGAPMGWYKVNLFLRRGTIQSRMQLCLLYSGASVAGFLGVSTSLVKPYGERGGDSRPWFLSRKFTLYQRYILPTRGKLGKLVGEAKDRRNSEEKSHRGDQAQSPANLLE